MAYPSIATAPKDGTVIWAGDHWMIYGRPYKWCPTLERWLCWFGLEQGFVRVSPTPKHWCPSLSKLAGEYVRGEKKMPIQPGIYIAREIAAIVTA